MNKGEIDRWRRFSDYNEIECPKCNESLVEENGDYPNYCPSCGHRLVPPNGGRNEM